MSDEPQIVRDFRMVDPRNAKPDADGGNAAARRIWLGPEPPTCHMLGCSETATATTRMRWQGIEHDVPICAGHERAIAGDALDHVSIGE